MAQLKFTVRQYLRWLPCGIFCDAWEGFIFYFFNIQTGKLWEVMPNHEIWVPRGMTSPRQAVGNDMKKYSLHLIFTFYINRVTLVLEIFRSLYFIENSFSINLCWPNDWQLKLSLTLLDRGRKIKNDVHINTYFCKTDLISWW